MFNAESNSSPRARRPRILIVEDEWVCQLLLQTFLKTFPVEVEHRPSAEAALTDLDRIRPDLILMDVMLGGMDGIEATELIRHRPGFEKTPIVMTTTLDDSVSSVEARDAGASTYLVKPIQLRQLREILDRFLGLGAAAGLLAAA